jgi:rhamnosyl/mannosyltransferase
VSAKRLSGLYNKLVFERHLGVVDRIVVSSPNYYQASSILPQFKDKITIIPYGIDLSHFAPSLGDEKRGQVGETRELELLFVGRLVRYKGIEYLISALASASGRLTVIGTGYLDTKLKAQVQELGLEDRVRFLGFVSDAELAECYAAADVIVLPSTDRGESFGYVLVEAMACHTAAVSTEIGSGTSFVNVHHETGFVVPPCDAHALAEAIGELNRDRALLSQFKLAARQRVEELFDVRTMLERTEVLYRELGVSI